MSEKELRRSMSVLPIGTVMKLTSLSARQIRYYEEQELVFPARSDGNRRLYSLNDVDRILEIQDYISDGLNIADIKNIYDGKRTIKKELSDSEIRQLLRDEMLQIGRLSDDSGAQLPSNRIK